MPRNPGAKTHCYRWEKVSRWLWWQQSTIGIFKMKVETSYVNIFIERIYAHSKRKVKTHKTVCAALWFATLPLCTLSSKRQSRILSSLSYVSIKVVQYIVVVTGFFLNKEGSYIIFVVWFFFNWEVGGEIQRETLIEQY